MKRNILFFIIIILYCSKIPGALELESKLDNSLLLTRYKNQSTDYSYFLLNSFDNKNKEKSFDFSFATPFLKAGRIKRTGIWKELVNPMARTANSDTFNETIGFERNFAFSKNGLYGLSLNADRGTGLGILFPDKLWAGGNYTFNADPLYFTFIVSVSELTNNSTKEWTSIYPNVPETIPMYIGLHSIYDCNFFKLDYLTVTSGSSNYKAGNFNRLFLEILTDTVNLKALVGVIDPYFISTEGKTSTVQFLIDLWAQFHINKEWKTIIKSSYSKEQKTVLQTEYIPTEGSSSFRLIYDNSKFNFYTNFGQNFKYDYYGTELVENSVNCKAGYLGLFSLSGSFGIVFDFEYLTGRQYELLLGITAVRTDLDFTLKHTESNNEAEQNTMKIKIDMELGKSKIYSTIILENRWELKDFTLGLKTVF